MGAPIAVQGTGIRPIAGPTPLVEAWTDKPVFIVKWRIGFDEPFSESQK